MTQGITQLKIDQRVVDLHGEYCHGRIDRRDFLGRAASIVVVGATGLAIVQALLPRYAMAQTDFAYGSEHQGGLRDAFLAWRRLGQEAKGRVRPRAVIH